MWVGIIVNNRVSIHMLFYLAPGHACKGFGSRSSSSGDPGIGTSAPGGLLVGLRLVGRPGVDKL